MHELYARVGAALREGEPAAKCAAVQRLRSDWAAGCVSGENAQAPVAYTIFVGFLVPIYWIYYGPSIFCVLRHRAVRDRDRALVRAPLGCEHDDARGVAAGDGREYIGFFSRLLGGPALFGLAGYMYDPSMPPLLRGLSLFRVLLPRVSAVKTMLRGSS